jgi:hypothetical protein
LAGYQRNCLICDIIIKLIYYFILIICLLFLFKIDVVYCDVRGVDIKQLYNLNINGYTILVDKYIINNLEKQNKIENMMRFLQIHNWSNNFRFLTYRNLDGTPFPIYAPQSHPNINYVLPYYNDIHINFQLTKSKEFALKNNFSQVYNYTINGVSDFQFISPIPHVYDSSKYISINYSFKSANDIDFAESLNSKKECFTYYKNFFNKYK